MICLLDLDAFFCACEEARRPELNGTPFCVGGNPDGRGVVATASYAARRYGIGSAMASAEARRRCPDLLFLPPDIAHYRRVSHAIWTALAGASEAVEQTGIDEGYLAAPAAGDHQKYARALQRIVNDVAGISCSVGVAAVKVAAKIAADVRKPGGITIVPAGKEAAFLAPLPVERLPGVGPKTARRLHRANITTIGDLAALDNHTRAAVLPGRHGAELRQRARAEDRRSIVTEPAEPVQLSRESTFERDIRRFSDLDRELDRLSAHVAGRLTERGRAGTTINVKLRYAKDFRTVTRSHTLPAPTHDRGVIAHHACRLAREALADRPGHLRLLGVGVSGLVAHWQLTFDDPAADEAPA